MIAPLNRGKKELENRVSNDSWRSKLKIIRHVGILMLDPNGSL
jgi:hypothetical protein